MEDYFKIRQLGENALMSAIGWAMYVTEPDEDVTEQEFEAKSAELRKKFEDDFNKYTFVKYQFEPDRDVYMDLDFQAARLKEAMKLVIEVNKVLLVDDTRKVCDALLEFTKYDYAYNIPEWQHED